MELRVDQMRAREKAIQIYQKLCTKCLLCDSAQIITVDEKIINITKEQAIELIKEYGKFISEYDWEKICLDKEDLLTSICFEAAICMERWFDKRHIQQIYFLTNEGDAESLY